MGDGFAHVVRCGLRREVGTVFPGGVDDLLKLLRHGDGFV
jgi:hypothetical protein